MLGPPVVGVVGESVDCGGVGCDIAMFCRLKVVVESNRVRRGWSMEERGGGASLTQCHFPTLRLALGAQHHLSKSRAA